MESLKKKLSLLRRFGREESGLEMVEWAVVAAVVTTGGAFALFLVGADLNVQFLQLRLITAGL